MANARWLVDEWNTRFAEVMQTMSDARPRMQCKGMKDLPKGERLWWRQEFSCSLGGWLWLGALEQDWSLVGQSVLSSAGVDDFPAAELRTTYLEIVAQSMTGLAEAIGDRLSNDVTCGEGADAAVELPDGRIFEVVGEFANSPAVTFCLIVSDKLAEALLVPVHDAACGESKPRAGSSPHARPNNVAGSRTFELLLDVELPVSVSFGKATLRIQEVMNLISGSLVELDRGLGDPVELLVNNSIIARGEVVVIEGNYGVRLTEIVSHKERLQQGRRQMLS